MADGGRIPLADRVARGPVLLDGATGTELIKAGLGAGETPEGWLLTRTAAVRALPAAYAGAGSDAVLTCTFGGNRVKAGRAGLDADLLRLNHLAVRVAREAVGDDRYVLGDLGPTGDLLEPYGDLEPAVARKAYAEQARALLEAGVDGIVVESFHDPAEAALAVHEARLAGAPYVIATMTFSDAAHGLRTIMGASPAACARTLLDAGAHAVGVNCGAGVEDGAAALAQMREAVPGTPLVFKPNAGIPKVVDGRAVYPLDPAAFLANLQPVLAAGAGFVGGCCGTTPAHVAALRKALGGPART